MPTKRVEPLLKKVGARLRKARLANRLSQEALAHMAGLDRSYVSGLERGEFNVSILVLHQLARCLGIRLSALIDGE